MLYKMCSEAKKEIARREDLFSVRDSGSTSSLLISDDDASECDYESETDTEHERRLELFISLYLELNFY